MDEFYKKNTRDGYIISRIYPKNNGLSFFGGTPTLPANIAWPVSEEDLKPLPFLAQIDMKDLQGNVPAEMPENGILYFFLGLDLEDGSEVGQSVHYCPKLEGVKPGFTPEFLPNLELGGWNNCYDSHKYNPFPLVKYPKYEIELIPFRDVRLSCWDDLNGLGNNSYELIEKESKKEIEKALASRFKVDYKHRTPKGWTEFRHQRLLDPNVDIKSSLIKDCQPGVSSLLKDWPQSWIFISQHLSNFFDLRNPANEKFPEGSLKNCFLDECRNWIESAKKEGAFTPLSLEEREKYRSWVSTWYINSFRAWSTLSGAEADGYYQIWNNLDEWLRFSALNATSLCVDAEQSNRLLISDEALVDFQSQSSPYTRHQMLGYGVNARTSFLDNPDMILLFQISTDYSMFWSFADCGMLQFWITKQDLLDRKFDKVIIKMENP